MEIFIQASQLLLSLSILIVLHELGHFLPARLFGTRVEKFYLFFDYKFSLFKIKKGGTEYGIGWIPLGGYVKISGMIDESMDKEQMAKPAEKWEFRAKPAWQRLIIMIGGVTVNLFLGFLIYSMILFAWGRDILPLSSAENGMQYDSLLLANGFKNGDKLLMVGDRAPYETQDIGPLLLLGDNKTATVDRAGAKMVLDLPKNFTDILLENHKEGALATPRIPGIIAEIGDGSPAEKCGLKKGDRIVRIDGMDTPFWDQAQDMIKASKGKQMSIEVIQANGSPKTVQVATNEEGMIGIAQQNPAEILKTIHKEYSFFQAIPAGVGFGVDRLGDYVSQFKLIFTKAGVKQLGGFASMGKLYPTTWDWERFWERTALISIILAFMNILPIPALDGGHIIFLLWEMIAGKPAPEKVIEYAQYVGMILLLGLMLFANGNDVFKIVSKYFG